MKHYLLLSLLITLLIGQSCKTTKNASLTGYLFKTEIQSNTILKTYTEQTMEMSIKMSGPGLPAHPTSVTTKSTGGTTMTIGDKNITGHNSILVAYDSLIVSASEVPGVAPPDIPDLSNGKIHGYYNGKSIIIDSISGLNDQLGNMLEQFSQPMFENLKINFPKDPMCLGDSFRDLRSMDLPMAGVGVGTMNFNTEYTLQKVADGLATFLTAVEITGSININDEESLITGTGNGRSVLNIEEKYVSFLEMTLMQSIGMKVQGMSINNTSVIHTKNKVVKENQQTMNQNDQ